MAEGVGEPPGSGAVILVTDRIDHSRAGCNHRFADRVGVGHIQGKDYRRPAKRGGPSIPLIRSRSPNSTD
jgi:hypothetical protein